MIHCTRLNLLFLAVLLCFIFGCGCAPKGEKGSVVNDSAGVLLDEGKGVCLDATTGKMWQVKRGGRFSSLEEANQYAANLQLADYDDWRLPSQDELFTLHYIYFWKKNGDCSMNRRGEYWTATAEAEPYPGHWETEVLCSPVHKYVNSVRKKGYVRAVRP